MACLPLILCCEDVGAGSIPRGTTASGGARRAALASLCRSVSRGLLRRLLAGRNEERWDQRADAREIEGKQALFVVNLAPREMAGEVSEGMLFDIGYSDGITPVLAIPERPVPNGTRAG